MNLAAELLARETGSGAVLRDGIVSTVSPLTVIVPPSTVASPAAALDSVNTVVGDFVQVLVQGANRLVLGGVGGSIGVVGYAEVTANQLNITTVVDVTGLTVTWTAVAGRRYRTSAQMDVYVTNVDTIPVITITDASNNIKTRGTLTFDRINAGVTTPFAVVETGLSGSTTRKVRAIRAVGTGNVNIQADATFPAFIMVEDVGSA